MTWDGRALDRAAPFYVAGHRGMVGSAVWRKLVAEGFESLIGRTSRDLDLTDRSAVFKHFRDVSPRYVVVAAAKVGGILANDRSPVEFLSENVRIQVNVLDAAAAVDVERLLFLGSSCIYPRLAPQPIPEEALLTGQLERTNDAYAIAKIAGILHVQAVRRQHGLPWISVMPTNLYGPGDNFSPESSHVLPSLIRRYDDAVKQGAATVTNWGTGTPRREFMHVDDLADACLHLLENYDDDSHVNVGTGVDVTIKDLAELVAAQLGYDGRTQWDETRPDGTPQKLLDVSRLAQTGWSATIGLTDGIQATVEWYQSHMDAVRQ